MRIVRRSSLLLVDLGLAATATVLALLLRDNLEFSLKRLQEILPYLYVSLAVAAPVMHLFGLNRGSWRFSTLNDYLRIIVAVIVTVLSALAVGFTFFRLDGVARSLPLLQGLLLIVMLVSLRVGARLLLSKSAERQRHLEPVVSGFQEVVLVVGLNSVTQLFLRSVAEIASSHIRVAGVLSHGDRYDAQHFGDSRVLGPIEAIETILKALEVHGVRVDRIVVTVAVDRLAPRAREALFAVNRSWNVRLDFWAERIGFHGPSTETATRVAGQDAPHPVSALEFDPIDFHRRPYWRAKRVADLVAAACLIVMLAPIALVVALVVLYDVGFPLLFWQERPGAWGRPFKLYKFRTMAAAYNAKGERVPDDQRLSAIGWYLRRLRLDELPQLFNILLGNMSFVGPRPLLPIDQSQSYASRLLVRPGLTGWAQVNGGRGLSPSDKAALDIWYVRNASFTLDLRILFATIPVLLRGESASPDAVQHAWSQLKECSATKGK